MGIALCSSLLFFPLFPLLFYTPLLSSILLFSILLCSALLLFFLLLYCAPLLSSTLLYSTLLCSTLHFSSDFESYLPLITHRTASQWEQEERQSEREREHIITEQDTAASHYNDLVRNMVGTFLITSEDYPRTIIQTESFKQDRIDRIWSPCHALCVPLCS